LIGGKKWSTQTFQEISCAMTDTTSDEILLQQLIEKANQGDLAAQTDLGVRYSRGEGVAKDYQEAARWYRLAAEQGHALAQLMIGQMYYEGKGLPQDFAEALKWFRKAADKEWAIFQHNIAVMYAKGQGVSQDLCRIPQIHRGARLRK
jgi:hypothetical protein